MEIMLLFTGKYTKCEGWSQMWFCDQINDRFLLPWNAAGAADMNKEQRNKE